MSAANWQLVGSTANQQWLNTFHESVPTSTSGPCPFSVIPSGCNPYTLVLGTGNGSIAYNIYRFGFTVTLQVLADRPTLSSSCTVTSLVPQLLWGGCYQQEIAALNADLGFINGGDTVTGNFAVDLSVPDPFSLSSFGGSTNDQFGIIGAWVAGSSACVAAPIQFGGSFQVSPCQSHSVIPNLKLAGTPSPTEPTSWYNNPITSGLNPNAVFSFNINKLQTVYSMVPCTSISGANCPASAQNDCSATGGCVVQYDPGMQITIPMVVDVIGSGPNLQQQAKNIGLITGTGTGNYVPTTGNILVTVKDASLGFPVNGVPVNYGISGQCAATTNYGNSGASGPGQLLIVGLPTTNQYSVCSTGQTGSVTLIFFQFVFQYSLANQNGISVAGGQTTPVNLVLQPSFVTGLTTLSIFLIVIGIVLLVVLVVLGGFGIGSVRKGLGATKSIGSWSKSKRKR